MVKEIKYTIPTDIQLAQKITQSLKKPDKRLFLLVITVTFIVFLFSSDGHRHTFDEDVANQEGLRIATMLPDPQFIPGESRLFFEYPELFPPEINTRPICEVGILCSAANIGHSLLEAPIIFVNHNLHIITDAAIYERDDYPSDYNFVYWKNNLNPDFIFLELIFGPLFSSLSVGVFFLVCRFFELTQKTSIVISFFYAFSTLTWAYSQMSLNTIPMVFFLLLGILFFAKFTTNHKNKYLIFSSLIFAFGFLVRNDMILGIIPIFGLLLFELKNNNKKIQKFISFVTPLIFVYIFNRLLFEIRFDLGSQPFTGVPNVAAAAAAPIYVGMAGLLFSPGVGLFIFVPILFTVFISFFDFYSKNKKFCLLFLSIPILFVIFYSTLEYWHGMVSWGPRYLVPIIPFLLIPLGFTLEKRRNKFLKSGIISLGIIGCFFNFVYIIQNVQWFIWGTMGQERGLYALARMEDGNVHSLWISPLTLYTFDYSQLTHSIIWAITNIQIDVFLFELLGPQIYFLALIIFLTIPIFYIFKILRQQIHYN